MMCLFQLHPFLRSIQFTNPAGHHVSLDKKIKLDIKYDILNLWNFPEGLRLKVKVGEFSPYAIHGQQLSLFQEMIQWATGHTEVCENQSQCISVNININVNT